MKLVAIPMIAKTQIQKIAPGPPTRIARIGPEMFPTPIRLPILMQKTWNDDTLLVSLRSSEENVTLHISLKSVICIPLSLIVQ